MSHISYSELKEWTDCAWKHKLNYIDKIKQFKGNEHTSNSSNDAAKRTYYVRSGSHEAVT